MTERYTYMPMDFLFDETSKRYGGHSISDTTKLETVDLLYPGDEWRNDKYHKAVKLKAGRDYVGAPLEYPTTTNLYAQTHTWQATALRSIAAFQVMSNLPDGTSIGLKVWNGTNWYYYKTSAPAGWTIAGTSNWSTEAEVKANIASLTMAARELAFRINLVTTDEEVTPTVYGVRVIAAMQEFSLSDDLISKGILKSLSDTLRPRMEARIKLSAASTTLSLAQYFGDTAGYDTLGHAVVGVDAAYNITNDAAEATNIMQSYNTTTKVLTFTASQKSATIIKVVASYKPYTAFVADREVYSVEVPFVVITEVTSEKRMRHNARFVVYNTEPNAVGVDGFDEVNFVFMLRLCAQTTDDLTKLSQELDRWAPGGGKNIECPMSGNIVFVDMARGQDFVRPAAPYMLPYTDRQIKVYGYAQFSGSLESYKYLIDNGMQPTISA